MIRKGSALYRLIAAPGLFLIRCFEFWVRRVAGDRGIYEAREFPWVAGVEARWRDMREELLAVLSDRRGVPGFEQISEEQARLVRPDSWKTFLFYTFGHKVAANCARCPKTTALLESIPGMTLGMFSILTPGSRIAPHRGVYTGVLRYHLALVVPAESERCAIRIDGDVHHWEEGRSLVFDDTHEHEAWNDTGENRVVLFVDFLRDLPQPLHLVNRGMLRLIGVSPFVQNMLANLARLEGRVADVPPRP